MSKLLIGLAITLVAITGCTYSSDQPTNTKSNGYYYYYNDSNIKDYSFNDFGFDVEI